MSWNWQLPDWPNFFYDSDQISQEEREFLLNSGSSSAFLKNIEEEEKNQFIVEMLSLEGFESCKIEGELLERESLKSSIKQHFGFQTDSSKQGGGKERGMAEMLCHVYATFDKPLTHEMLLNWHSMLFKDANGLLDPGKYRTHMEPMQIVSRRLDSHKVFFEAPPSERVLDEMTRFIHWFNESFSEPILGRSSPVFIKAPFSTKSVKSRVAVALDPLVIAI